MNRNNMQDNWFKLNHPEKIDSPALLVYLDRAKKNIEKVIQEVGTADRLRPHVKTNKSAEACLLMMDAGITAFKGATIAEIELLATVGAKDILMAYQPVGPKVDRFLTLVAEYPEVKFQCLIDHVDAAKALNEKALEAGQTIGVYIDLNAGTNRTGIAPGAAAEELFEELVAMEGLQVVGFHLYDGHLRDPDLKKREAACDAGFAPIAQMREKLEKKHHITLDVIAGGSTTFPFHSKRERITCAPGTFIYWDEGYASGLPEQSFLYAALVLCRVVSLPTSNYICVDLGYKAIASENPLDNRVKFLNAPELEPVSHSEEHLVLEAKEGHSYKIGDVLYAVPIHICPTVASYQEALVIQDGEQVASWKTLARDRRITF
ncbi:D-TA family PLP-dependent enzyme [Cyclobacterium sp. 1_MG-2023]|uniref:D-TA family PLP-dependent enzyme n=1 Tax=Cyclobacterium sp. 1_MG-2023 TaxID=3062681 RepID=UPI0026E3F3AA|nr:D-TA family PLP-dependent enzyme [Cyclobacterium sp. 1_MG-2023]MDO6439841.1 D-TA family PLP-dependent enzyme [Cyclobacterium sp. 1_MG-2023]